MPPKIRYLLYYFIIIFVTPLLTSLLNFWFFKDVLLNYSATLELLRSGKMHYGFAKYLTYPVEFFLYFITIRLLLKRFALFDFESKRFNLMVVVFIILLSGLLLEYILEGISVKGQWWVYINYISQKEFWNLELGIFMIPAFLESGMIYGFLLIFAKLSDLDPILKSVKNILKKSFWAEQELQEVLSYRYKTFFINEDYTQTVKLFEEKRGEKTFIHKDLQKFDNFFEKKETIL
jgi:hypothetical protein